MTTDLISESHITHTVQKHTQNRPRTSGAEINNFLIFQKVVKISVTFDHFFGPVLTIAYI